MELWLSCLYLTHSLVSLRAAGSQLSSSHFSFHSSAFRLECLGFRASFLSFPLKPSGWGHVAFEPLSDSSALVPSGWSALAFEPPFQLSLICFRARVTRLSSLFFTLLLLSLRARELWHSSLCLTHPLFSLRAAGSWLSSFPFSFRSSAFGLECLGFRAAFSAIPLVSLGYTVSPPESMSSSLF